MQEFIRQGTKGTTCMGAQDTDPCGTLLPQGSSGVGGCGFISPQAVAFGGPLCALLSPANKIPHKHRFRENFLIAPLCQSAHTASHVCLYVYLCSTISEGFYFHLQGAVDIFFICLVNVVFCLFSLATRHTFQY